MVEFISLSSGSNGNCYYIGDGTVSLLIDAGIGVRTIKKRLAEHNVSYEAIEMVLVTHDHIDHIKALGSLAERLLLPVYTSMEIHNSLTTHFCTRGKLNSSRKFLKKREPLEYKSVKITPFEVPHDSTDNLGYFLEFSDNNLVFITDAGEFTDEMDYFCRKANHIILESNYDEGMLFNGSYPQELKHRIKNGSGHLSNRQTAEAIKRIYHPGLKTLFLCHLSANNNTPELALNSAKYALEEIGVSHEDSIKVVPLPRSSAYHSLIGS